MRPPPSPNTSSSQIEAPGAGKQSALPILVPNPAAPSAAAIATMATPPPPKLLCECDRSLLDLPDELIPEILHRLPPHDPGSLVRCSAVCKLWRRLFTDPAFLRGYRAFHGGAPPMLGFLFTLGVPGDSTLARFVRTTPFRPRSLDHAGCHVRDARHGRILFSNHTFQENDDELFVWSPVTGERRGLDRPRKSEFNYWSVAVLCAAAAREGGGDCDRDHLDCHGKPFLVAYVETDGHRTASALVYSSETDAWSDETYAQHPFLADIDMMEMDPIALVGNRIYFPTRGSETIVEYDLGRRELAFVDPPANQGRGILMPAIGGGGGLGFASVRGSCLYLWSRETGSDRAAAAWTQSRVLQLNSLPIVRTAVGFAEGLGVIFVSTSAGVFAINLESGQVKKMSSRRIDFVVPYMSFYTPDKATG